MKEKLIAVIIGLIMLSLVLGYSLTVQSELSNQYSVAYQQIKILKSQEVNSRDKMIVIQKEEIERLRSQLLTDERINELLTNMKNQNDYNHMIYNNSLDQLRQDLGVNGDGY